MTQPTPPKQYIKPMTLDRVTKIKLVDSAAHFVEPRMSDVHITFTKDNARETIKLLQEWLDSPISRISDETAISFMGRLRT